MVSISLQHHHRHVWLTEFPSCFVQPLSMNDWQISKPRRANKSWRVNVFFLFLPICLFLGIFLGGKNIFFPSYLRFESTYHSVSWISTNECHQTHSCAVVLYSRWLKHYVHIVFHTALPSKQNGRAVHSEGVPLFLETICGEPPFIQVPDRNGGDQPLCGPSKQRCDVILRPCYGQRDFDASHHLTIMQSFSSANAQDVWHGNYNCMVLKTQTFKLIRYRVLCVLFECF